MTSHFYCVDDSTDVNWEGKSFVHYLIMEAIFLVYACIGFCFCFLGGGGKGIMCPHAISRA